MIGFILWGRNNDFQAGDISKYNLNPFPGQTLYDEERFQNNFPDFTVSQTSTHPFFVRTALLLQKGEYGTSPEDAKNGRVGD